MFIRLRDTAKIISDDIRNDIVFYDENNSKTLNRKWNKAKKFTLSKNDINYIDDELVCKLIPKDKASIINDKTIKQIFTDNGDSLIFQDFEEVPCRFLTLNEKTDNIEIIEFYELVPQKTEILCFDKSTEDYYLSLINTLNIVEPIVNDINNEFHTNEVKLLSKYLIYTEPMTGLIINNIYIL